MILLIDNYDSFTFNLYQLIAHLGYGCKVVRNDELSVGELEGLKPSHVIVSPGPGRPDKAGVTVELIRHLQGRIPILGICLGHQAIGQAFGGRVVHAPSPMHGQTSVITHQHGGLFSGMPSSLTVARYHSLVVDKESLPSCLMITSETADGIIMGLRHRTMAIEGLQFHPESIATPEGPRLVENFLKRVGQ